MRLMTILATSFFYFMFAMIFGVFYREFVKYHNFTGRTNLSVVHSHLLVFGMILFLIIFVLSLNSQFVLGKSFKVFYYMYNVSFIFMISMLIVRGIIQVKNLNLTRMQNGMVSGFAGLSHLMMMISLIQFFVILFKFCKQLGK